MKIERRNFANKLSGIQERVSVRELKICDSESSTFGVLTDGATRNPFKKSVDGKNGCRREDG